ncbi:hypothetical protein F5Y19DRAFT_491957 [Xylariaceae sp. FL1651]|nr:hypothetical protein F5Y19DRAFT_491957 [Xylariaceae sp. FL1651]
MGEAQSEPEQSEGGRYQPQENQDSRVVHLPQKYQQANHEARRLQSSPSHRVPPAAQTQDTILSSSEDEDEERQDGLLTGYSMPIMPPLIFHSLKEKEIRGLLPSSDHFLRELRGEYWSEETEEAFSKLWTQDKYPERFVASPRGMSDEVELWKLILMRFDRTLPHLLTYGLRLHQDCYQEPGSIMLSSEASNLLEQICVHPVWGKDLESLRYVLQKAVQFHVHGHIEPIGPPPRTSLLEASLTASTVSSLDQRQWLMGIFQYDLWLDNKPDRNPSIRRLISIIQRLSDPETTEDQVEKVLFILSIDIMKHVVLALDYFDRSTYRLSAKESIQWFRNYNAEVLDHVRPRDANELMALKWSWELCQLRDIEIRKVMRTNSKGDILPDIPHLHSHNYNVPLYHHHPDLDKRAVSMLRGKVMDPKRATLQKLDRQDSVRAKELDDFSAMLLKGENDAEPTNMSGKLTATINSPVPTAHRRQPRPTESSAGLSPTTDATIVKGVSMMMHASWGKNSYSNAERSEVRDTGITNERLNQTSYASNSKTTLPRVGSVSTDLQRLTFSDVAALGQSSESADDSNDNDGQQPDAATTTKKV